MKTYRVTGVFTLYCEVVADNPAAARDKAFTRVTIREMREYYGWEFDKPVEMTMEEVR